MSDPIATFQGLGTGIQFRDLVDSIIQAESQPINLVRQQINQAQARKQAWSGFRTRVQNLNTEAAGLADLSRLRVFNTAVGDASLATVTAGTGAREGAFSLAVDQLATREKVGSDVFASRTEALGLSGEFVINGRSVSISEDQSLEGVVRAVNATDSGTAPSGVSASIVGTADEGYRMVLTSQDSGAVGLQLFDGATGLLQSLGFLDTTVALRQRTSDGAMSSGFTSASGSVNGMLALTTPPSGTVDIGGLAVDIDLSVQSLEDIAGAINTAAAGAGSAISAAVVQDEGSVASYRLDISGTTSFTDSNAVLESLGVLERGRAAVSQQLQAAAFTAGDATTVATGATLLTDLWAGGAATGVQAGDTLEFQGTRGDGTTFTQTFTVGAGSTYQDVVDALNSATEGFQTGERTATAAIDAEGRIVVTDDTGGSSQLALALYTNNEGGGSLDFGQVQVTTEGRQRELVAGQDAVFQVDGQSFVRSTNTISDVVDGVTVNLTGTSEEATEVQVTRDLEAAADAMGSFVDAMNDIMDFTTGETFTDGERQVQNALRGDGVLRGLRGQLKRAFETTLSDLFGDVRRLGDVGITIQRSGEYEFDRTAFTDTLQTDPAAVERLFQVTGSGSVSTLQYVFSGDDTQVGTYAVNITQAAARATASSAGFGGTYVDDGTADTLQITESRTGSVYDVALNNGDTAEDIAAALNTRFGTGAARELQSSTVLYADGVGTVAGSSTALQDLYNGSGTTLGVADGDVFTISGTDDNGNSFLSEFTVSDVTTQTLDDLADAVSDALGTDVEVGFDGGLLTATSTQAGARSFTLSVTSDNAGGGSFSVGSLGAVTEGRSADLLSASVEAGELVIRSDAFGAAAGFDLAVVAGGGDGSASLGLTAGSYAGTDVQGSIGGEVAEGAGRNLTGAEGTPADGLVISYGGADTGVVGEFSFSRGIASILEQVTDQFLRTGGVLGGIDSRIDDQVERYNDRIDRVEDRLARRRVALLEQFTRLEESIAEANSRGQFLLSQLGSLPQGGGGLL